jgi:hypothetical protein
MTNEATWRSRIWAKGGLVREERTRRVLLHADSGEVADSSNPDTGFNAEFRVDSSALAGRCNSNDDHLCPGCRDFTFNNSAFCSEYLKGLCTSAIYVPPTTHFYDFHSDIHFIVDPVHNTSSQSIWDYVSTCDCERMAQPARLVGAGAAAAHEPLPELARIDLDYLVDKKFIPLTEAPCVGTQPTANCSFAAAPMNATATVTKNVGRTSWEYKWHAAESKFCCGEWDSYTCQKPYIVTAPDGKLTDNSLSQQHRDIVGEFRSQHRYDANLGGLVPVDTRAALTVELWTNDDNDGLPWPITDRRYDPSCVLSYRPVPADQNSGASLYRQFEQVEKYEDSCSTCAGSDDKSCSCVKIPDVCLKPSPQNKCKLI